ncbi:hypothetical protein BZJ19_08270 [Salinivibrio proteolyticus]|uniref:DUF3319 domain-containing protein n=1 Tax=Salinivibrio costicola TaxID=51367 RepID=A0ABX6K8T7_SALCS|nr:MULTISPECIES: DUF3319 domain-containing protein [Salinivibrio]OOF09670.1 hypothetical protein BZG82_10480 [Salinivibrio sp. PR5]OOF10892.1 hypothetical protein BZG83_13245 [Salinivibrio sp. PR919]OOF17797.1 hypothetical protein BZG84_05685 [Salinivibrio sp. PR932]OOF25621.1 hypothetical protein BZJ19_08270 [Salinivibrio proteolyticus]OOF31183.1 hypothetical protein BZJ20_06495 [Salinivibrio proteolyticus]
MTQRLFHRGYTIEKVEGSGDIQEVYRARLGGKVVSGSLTGVKKSIEWWVDTSMVTDPAEFDALARKQTRQVEEYKGFRLMNDDPEKDEKGWYMMVRGNLMKGTLPALKLYIDRNGEKLRA